MKVGKNEQNKNEQLQITLEGDRDKDQLRYILEAAEDKANEEIKDASMGEWKERAEILTKIGEIKKELGPKADNKFDP